jgi:3-deoxy-7-phosphoheptulonate synthase
MIIMLKPEAADDKVMHLSEIISNMGVEVMRSDGTEHSVLHLIGDTSKIDKSIIEASDIVHKIIRVQEPYKRANRLFHPEDTIVEVNGHKIGSNEFVVMAGPCAVESEEQIVTIAKLVKEAGATMLRGGAFKPRTSPYSFQGMGAEGIRHLNTAKEETGLPIVTEILSADMIELFVNNVDVIQVGARNMQNFQLLKELGKTKTPILLKRGMVATIEEWLMSAEYIMSEGNPNVILCERGIRTFENYTRNTLDISAVPVVKRLSHLPVIVDPSHAGGAWWLVQPLAECAVVAGAAGITVEVHNEPEKAMSDGGQSLKPKKFASMMDEIEKLAHVKGMKIVR